MTFPIVTAWLAIFLSLVVMYFISKVAKIRRKEQIELETAENEQLRRAVRCHGNLVETAPLFLIMLAFLEMAGANSIAVIVLALVFAISRILHPIGLSGVKGTFKFRVYGMTLTLTIYILTALYLAFMLSFSAITI